MHHESQGEIGDIHGKGQTPGYLSGLGLDSACRAGVGDRHRTEERRRRMGVG